MIDSSLSSINLKGAPAEALNRHINAVARAALDEGGFLDGPEDPKRAGRAKGKRKP